MKLSSDDMAVLVQLSKGLNRSGSIATMCNFRTQSPKEKAARHLIRLTKSGYAEQTGTRMFPTWRITDLGLSKITA